MVSTRVLGGVEGRVGECDWTNVGVADLGGSGSEFMLGSGFSSVLVSSESSGGARIEPTDV